MSSTSIHSVPARGPILAFATTNASTTAANTRTLSLGRAVTGISAQVVVSTGSATIAFDGSLYPTGGWTSIKSTSWTSTQQGRVRIVQAPYSTAAVPYTHLRVTISDMSTAPGAGGADVKAWVAVV